MFAQFPEFGLMSLGVMVCMISSGIDLSTVGVANMTSITMALLMRRITKRRKRPESLSGSADFHACALIGAAAGLERCSDRQAEDPANHCYRSARGELFSGIGIVLTGGSAIGDFSNLCLSYQ